MADSVNAPATDDQELANMLAGLNNGAPATATPPTPGMPTPAAAKPSPMQFESTPPAPSAVPTPMTPPMPGAPTPVAPPTPGVPNIGAPAHSPKSPAGTSPDLDAIKKDALAELRPLVNKLDLPADEKFDTLLLIIRSTDDQSLLKPAHEAAKNITDEAKRAQALLDIIKEIDFFGNPQA